jgi:LuxR family transcriptional regulator, maltose regulon positive regulatory protein
MSASPMPAFVQTSLSTRLWTEMKSGGPGLNYLCAPTGFGKTAVLQFLQREAEKKNLKVILINCREVPSADRHAAPFNQLTQRVFGPTLVLIDNADEAPQFVTPARLTDWAGAAPEVHYVVASRTLPRMNWLALQLSGNANLLRAEHLRLDSDEVAKVLEHYSGRHASPAIVRRVIELTEGWPLAVQLCGVCARNEVDWLVSLRNALEHAVSLAVYFEDTVFARLSSSMRAFLTAVAPLDQFSADFCRDVLDRPDADALFVEAINSGLFVVPAAQAGWYRLHTAFRNYLNHRTREFDSANSTALLTRARDWCLSHDQGPQSIEYSLRIGDLQSAKQTLLRIVPECIGEFCRLGDVIRWAETIERAPGDPPFPLRLWKIGALVFSVRLRDARRECERLEASLDFAVQLQREPSLAMQLDHIRCSIAIKSDAMTEAAERARAWLDCYKTAPAFYRVAVAVTLAASCFARGDRAEYLRCLEASKHIANEAGSAYADAWVGALEVLDECSGGHIDSAQRLADDALESARRIMGDDCPIVATLSLLMARILCEKGLFQDAKPHLERGLMHLGDHGLIETAIAGLEAVVAVTEARSGCSAALAEVRHHARAGVGFAPRFEIEVARIVVMLLLRAGEVAAAREEFNLKIARAIGAKNRDVADPAIWNELEKNCRFVGAAVLVAEGNHNAALALCRNLLPSAGDYGRTRRLVELRILKAAALHGSGNIREANNVFGRALTIASKRGYLQTMCDLDWAIRPFVSGAVQSAVPHFVDELRQRLRLFPTEADGTRNADSGVDPLTEREIELLDFLDSSLTNQEVAKRLHLSVATVKWHLQNIYTKLAVSNRSGALSKARRCGLLGGFVCRA